MKKYLSLLKYEMKTILKDSLSIFMLIYPLLVIFMMGFTIPAILERTTDVSSNANMNTLLIGFVVTLAMGGFVSGAMLGFSILENKDENTLINIAVTPITVSGYTVFKITYTAIIAFFGNIVMVGGLKIIATDKYLIEIAGNSIYLLDAINWPEIIVFSIVSSLTVPMIALVIGMVAKNKVEGFAIMKSFGLVVMLPVLSLLNVFHDAKQYILGIIPNFWTMKALLNEVYGALGIFDSSNMNFYMYMLIGAIYTSLVGVLAIHAFVKKSHLK